ncbi:MarR family winged helix-turn-helix transcriptional regulator [Dysosmobacter sp.]
MMDISRGLRFYQQFHRFYNRCLTPLMERQQLSLREIQVLLFLANNPGCDTARDVEKLRGLAKSQVSAAVEHLTGRGLLRRLPDQRDRRIVRLSITEAGWPIAREAQRIQARCGGALLEGLSREELTQMQGILEKVLANGERLAGKESLE